MSKTLEKLGYKKIVDDEYQTVYKNSYGDEIVFGKLTKSVSVDDRLHWFRVITMEELKAIYKYCEDNKWI